MDLGVFTGDLRKVAEIAKRFSADHSEHADAVNSLAVKLGAKEFRCSNTRISESYILPALKLITAADNPNQAIDIVALAHAVENLAAQTYQGVVALLTDPMLRADAIRIGQQEARHAAILAQILNPGLKNVGQTSDEKTGKPNISAVPTEFGSLANIQLAVGKPKPDGTRTTLILETPSLNSLVYDFVTCEA